MEGAQLDASFGICSLDVVGSAERTCFWPEGTVRAALRGSAGGIGGIGGGGGNDASWRASKTAAAAAAMVVVVVVVADDLLDTDCDLDFVVAMNAGTGLTIAERDVAVEARLTLTSPGLGRCRLRGDMVSMGILPDTSRARDVGEASRRQKG